MPAPAERGADAAGAPLEAVEQREPLNLGEFAAHEGAFALEVRGDSMIDDHIRDGDLILLEKIGEARDGDIVVALVRGMETTLKRFYREPDDQVRLQPANAAMAPIVLPAREVQIQGRLMAVLRKYR